MDQALKDTLKSLSKDDSAFEKLKDIYSELYEKKEEFEQHLKLLERAIENDYDSILITELNLEKPGPKIVYVNEGFTKISGYSRDEIIGETPRILQGPKTDRDTLDRLKNRLNSGRAFFGQAVNYRKDGTEFINQWDIHPLTDDEGKITHWVSYQHDITKRKRAEAKVIDTQAEFDTLRESSKSTVLDIAPDGSILFSNKAFRNLTGYDKDELEGRKFWDLFPQKYRASLKPRFKKEFEAVNFTGQKLEGIIKHKQGLPIQVECRMSVLELKDKDLIRVNVRNMSLEKRIMETLKKRNTNYSKIFNRPTEFTYKISLRDDQLHVEYVSEEFARVTGIKPEKVVDANGLQSFVHEDDIEKVTEHIRNVLDGNAGTCEYRIRTAGGYVSIIDYAKPGTCMKNGENDCVRGAVRFKEKGKAMSSES